MFIRIISATGTDWSVGGLSIERAEEFYRDACESQRKGANLVVILPPEPETMAELDELERRERKKALDEFDEWKRGRIRYLHRYRLKRKGREGPMKIRVYHDSYGCDTGCCGHVIEVDGKRSPFDAGLCSHPDTKEEAREFAIEFAKQEIRKYHPQCFDSIDWNSIDHSEVVSEEEET